MEGVTTAIVAFIFVCIAWPHLIKNRHQFYAALGLILLVIFFDCLGHMSNPASAEGGGGFRRFCYVVNAFLQIASILLLVLSTGGQTLGELAGDVGKTIDVVRRGGESETIIVPLSGEQPKPRDRGTVPARPAPRDEDTSIPME